MAVDPVVPWYLNWTFWTAVFAATAIILSQIPPISQLIRKAKLDFEVHSRIYITHKVGNPNAQIHLIINNTGGRTVKIKEIWLHFSRDGEDTFSLLAQSYYQSPADRQTVLFTRTTLKPGEEWGHIIHCFNFYSRNVEKEFQQMKLNLYNYITAALRKKREESASGQVDKDQKLVEAPPDLMEPIMEFHKRNFKWHRGEYFLDVEIKAIPDQASLIKRYRSTLFESDESELQGCVDEYKYGVEILFDSKTSIGISLPLSEV